MITEKNQKTMVAHLIVPTDRNIRRHQWLKEELKKKMKAKMISIIVGALGVMVPKLELAPAAS